MVRITRFDLNRTSLGEVMRITGVPVFVALTLVLGCGTPAPPLAMPSLDHALDSLASDALASGPSAGLSVAVVRRGEVVYARGHGSADLAQGRDVTPETVFVAASVTKLLTSLAVLRLVAEGELGLDDRLADLLPAFPNREQGERITVRAMLNHTSGLPDLLGPVVDRWLETGAPADPEFVLAWLRDRPLDFDPGTHWVYSNTGFYLLGLVIEDVAGRPYGDYVREEVALPLGLEDTFLCDDWLFPDRRTVGYEPGEEGLAVSANYETTGVKTGFGAAGGFCTTPLDLASLPGALSSSGLLPDSLLAMMLAPTTLASGATVDYGLGVRLGRVEGNPVWGHSGGSASTWALLVHYPDSAVSVAAMVNTDGARPDAWMLGGSVSRRVLGLDEARIDAVTLADPRLYEGRYGGGRGNREFEVRAEGATLFIRELNRDRPPTEAIAIGPHEFALASAPMDRIVFDVRDGVVLGYSIYFDGLFWEYRRPLEPS